MKSDSADFVKNRMAMQQEHMKTIWEKFDGSVRAVVPLFEAEIRGTPMLKRLGEAMFADSSAALLQSSRVVAAP